MKINLNPGTGREGPGSRAPITTTLMLLTALAASAQTTSFTATGGLWKWSWTGVMQTDNSAQVRIVGYGSGGTIEGLRLEQTMTRGAATNAIDPTVPYLYTGTIKPAPLNTTAVVSDSTKPFTCPIYGSGTCSNSNGQFHAVGDFRVVTDSFDTFLLAQQCDTAPGWTVTNGTTREWRADLVSLDDNATNMAQLAVSAYPAPGYGFHKGRDFAYLMK
jgi:hypothetical protein